MRAAEREVTIRSQSVVNTDISRSAPNIRCRLGACALGYRVIRCKHRT